MAKSPRGSNAAIATVDDQEPGRISELGKLLWGREPTVKMR